AKMKSGKLSSNMEDYLEAVAAIKKEKGVARVRDIGRLLNVKKPSVTSALNTLSRAGLVLHERYGYVELTPEGQKIASGVQSRHNILVKFLTNILSIAPRIAAEDACRLEHSISPLTLGKLTKFIAFVETCPDHNRPDWLKSFDHYFKTGKRLRCKFRKTEEQQSVK
ncbi:MAG: metal-dependent transcriptional regulator, partial [Kiritimatiellia bacterium]|nr:metal-dependent transcriptional regulator [Kiritimatiellia bacterium]